MHKMTLARQHEIFDKTEELHAGKARARTRCHYTIGRFDALNRAIQRRYRVLVSRGYFS